jgi:hypothetical protein
MMDVLSDAVSASVRTRVAIARAGASCFRAIMNTRFGLEAVLERECAVEAIAALLAAGDAEVSADALQLLTVCVAYPEKEGHT